MFYFDKCNWKIWLQKWASNPLSVNGLLIKDNHCVNFCTTGAFAVLTHWGWEKMNYTLQTSFSIAFHWMKKCEFRLKFPWSFFLMAHRTISRWAIIWLSDGLVSWSICASLGLNHDHNTCRSMGWHFIPFFDIHKKIICNKPRPHCCDSIPEKFWKL